MKLQLRPHVLRPEVQAFAELMEAQLRANDHKGRAGWKDSAPHLLLARVFDELAEALTTIKPENSALAFELLVVERLLGLAGRSLRGFGSYAKTFRDPNTASELADVANMIMMVADVLGCLTKEPA